MGETWVGEASRLLFPASRRKPCHDPAATNRLKNSFSPATDEIRRDAEFNRPEAGATHYLTHFRRREALGYSEVTFGNPSNGQLNPPLCLSRPVAGLDTFAGRNFGISQEFRRIFDGIGRALGGRMVDVLLIVFGLFAACLVTELYSVAAAPLGYQDNEDFKFGSKRSAAEDPINPS